MSDFAKTLWSANNLKLWKSYCDKKIECENLQEQLTTITKQRDELLKCLETVNSHAVYCAGTFNNGETVAQYAARVISTIKEQKDAE